MNIKITNKIIYVSKTKVLIVTSKAYNPQERN